MENTLAKRIAQNSFSKDSNQKQKDATKCTGNDHTIIKESLCRNIYLVMERIIFPYRTFIQIFFISNFASK